MKRQTFNLMIAGLALLLSSCAASYRPIAPKNVNYTYINSSESNGIDIGYRYDVLREKGNKKYAKKEDKSGVRLVAIKLTNNTASTINVSRDLMFYSGNNPINLMDPLSIKNDLKQIVPTYLLYLLLTPLQLYVNTDNSTETYPIGLILGPGLSIGNMAVAGSSNSSLLSELTLYSLINKDIASGETVFGIIGVRDYGYSPISVKFRNN